LNGQLCVIMEAGETQKAQKVTAAHLKVIWHRRQKLFAAAWPVLRWCFDFCSVVLGARVILINLKGMSEDTATPTLDMVAFFYQV
jgi:hypothetical protein